MKVLFDHPSPFFLAHGGFQIQIEQTKSALEGLDVDVEWMRWWDAAQAGDIIHYFGRPAGGYVDLAHKKGIKVVVGELHTGLGSRSAKARRLQKAFMTFGQRLLPGAFTARLAWDTYRKADAFVALTQWEGQLMREMFDAPADLVHVIPNGVEEVFFQASARSEAATEDYLVCTATITERKRVVELAEAAVRAQVPVWIVGRPYADTDPYYLRFMEIHRKAPGIVRYEGPVEDRARIAEIYRRAKGFVLLSTMESLSLSALEATAAGCPLLLTDLPWARGTFGGNATYVSPAASTEATAESLQKFSHEAAILPRPPAPMTWPQVAAELREIYLRLKTSR